MMVPWILRMLTATVLVAAAVIVLDRVMSAGRSRRWAWAGGTALVLVLPVLGWLLPSLPGAPRVIVDALSVRSGEVLAAPGHVVAADASGFAGAGQVIVWFWVIAGVGCLALYAAGWWRLGRARRAWRADNVAGTSVLVSVAAGPAAVGVLQPAIVVPEWLLSEDEPVQRLVVLHEAEHLAAGDHILLAVAPLALVLMPWNIGLWWMLRRLRLAVELDCDRRVLSRGIHARMYGSLLLDVAGRRGVGDLAIAMASPRSNLEKRILALTAGIQRRGSAVVSLQAGLAVCLVVLACGVAPQSPLEPENGLASMQRPALTTDWLDRFADIVGVQYTLDGNPATEDELRSLATSVIARVAVTEETLLHGQESGEAQTVARRTVNVHTKNYAVTHPVADDIPHLSEGATMHEVVRSVLDRFPGQNVRIRVDGEIVDPDQLGEYEQQTGYRVTVARMQRGAEASTEIHIETK